MRDLPPDGASPASPAELRAGALPTHLDSQLKRERAWMDSTGIAPAGAKRARPLGGNAGDPSPPLGLSPIGLGEGFDPMPFDHEDDGDHGAILAEVGSSLLWQGSETGPAPDASPSPETGSNITGKHANPGGFATLYNVHNELRRGAYDATYRCQAKDTEVDVVARIVDLRSMRQYAPEEIPALAREFQVLRLLRHRNLPQLRDAFETPFALILVLSLCPGVTLAAAQEKRPCYPEPAAAVIFVECLLAMRSLHQERIAHGSIRAEHVWLCEPEDTQVQPLPMVKLIGFGRAEVQSTPEAPGAPGDMRDAGAMLHGMLVGKSPDPGSLRPPMEALRIAGISSLAQELIQSLLEPDAHRRFTVGEALAHPWLSDARRLIEGSAVPGGLHSRRTQAAAGSMEAPPAGPPLVAQQSSTASVVSRLSSSASFEPLTSPTMARPEVSRALALAHAASSASPLAAAEVRRSAVAYRTVQVESVALLRRVQQTADSVLDLLPDLELAVSEQEPTLAAEFFSSVRAWVRRLEEDIGRLRTENGDSASVLAGAAEAVATYVHAKGLALEAKPKASATAGDAAEEAKSEVAQNNAETGVARHGAPQPAAAGAEAALPGRADPSAPPSVAGGAPPAPGRERHPAPGQADGPTAAPRETAQDGGGGARLHGVFAGPLGPGGEVVDDMATMSEEEIVDLFLRPCAPPADPEAAVRPPSPAPSALKAEAGAAATGGHRGSDVAKRLDAAKGDAEGKEAVRTGSVMATRTTHAKSSAVLAETLAHLGRVDTSLHRLESFWSSTAVLFDSLLQRSDHVERFVKFAHNPRLAQRFRERLEDYQRFWESVRTMAVDCIMRQGPGGPPGDALAAAKPN